MLTVGVDLGYVVLYGYWVVLHGATMLHGDTTCGCMGIVYGAAIWMH